MEVCLSSELVFHVKESVQIKSVFAASETRLPHAHMTSKDSILSRTSLAM
jgi:hypothetical protein